MVEFKLKLAAILLDTPLNTAKEDEAIVETRDATNSNVNNEDCFMLDASQQVIYGIMSQPYPCSIKESTIGICKSILLIDDMDTLE